MAEAPVGIIYPPPDIRGVIDTTAQFVSKHGPEFEARVLREQNNAKFAFLQRSNPYRAYYDQRVGDFKAGRTEEVKPDVPVAIQEMKKKEEDKKRKKDQLKALTLGTAQERELVAPAEDQYTLQHPFLAPIDLDIIKTTAQFVARNGQKFLVGLTQKETKNPQFDFLKPTHQLFGYFTALVDSYTKCLMPEKHELEKLKRFAEHPMVFLNQSLRRFDYERAEFKKAEDQEKTAAAERDAFAQIDWHDFCVVETIEFTAEDEGLQLSAPLQLDQLTGETISAGGAAPLALGVVERNRIIDEDEAMEIEMEDGEDMELEEQVAAAEQPAEEEQPKAPKKPVVQEGDEDALPLPEDDAPMFVVKDYARQPRKVESTSASGLLKCPITGQMVPAEDMTGHLKVLLLDPKWKMQKDQLLERARKESAFDDNVEANLAGFVAKRPDLFGDVEEQIRQHAQDSAEAAAREAGADAGPAHATFGHLTVMRDALELEKTAAKPNKSALPSLPGGAQLALPTAETEAGEGAARQVMLTNPRLDGGATAPKPVSSGLGALGLGDEDDEDFDEEPSAKRRKMDATGFQPEAQWAASHPAVKLIVQVLGSGAMGSSTVTIEAQSSMRVSEFKDQLRQHGAQIARMRLVSQEHRWVLKDAQTLAFYNLASGTVLEAKAQERGGARK